MGESEATQGKLLWVLWLKELALLGPKGLQRQGGSSGRSQSHQGDCAMGAGTRGNSVTAGDIKRNREGGRNTLFLTNSCSQIFPHCPPWAKLSRKQNQGTWEMRFLVIQRSQQEWKLDLRANRLLQSTYPSSVHAMIICKSTPGQGKIRDSGHCSPGWLIKWLALSESHIKWE